MPDGPLASTRILDLTHVWAGPLGTRILADLGADVLKLEASTARGPAEVPDRIGGPYPGGVPGEEPWNRQVPFNKLNRNKRGLCINLKSDEGREVFLELAAVCDVVIENFSTRAMKSLRLNYEELRKVNPAIVYVAMPGYGTRGPVSDFVAFGPSVEPMTGLTSIMGYDPHEPRTSAMALPDAVAGVTAATAVLTALHKRRETGEGGFIDLSLHESAINMVGEYLIEKQMTGRQPPVYGNRHEKFAPQGIYPCADGEDGTPDNWIAISCRDQQQWVALCEIAGTAWHREERFRRPEWRRANHDALDELITRFTATRDKIQLMHELQRAGVPAGAVMTAPEFMTDEHIVARDFFKALSGDHIESVPYPGTPIMIDGRRNEGWTRAPCLGEHNEEVLTELLGMDKATFEDLTLKDILRTRPSI